METSRKSLKCLGLMNKYQLTTQKSKFGSCVTKLEKLNREAFGRKHEDALFGGFAYSISSKFIWLNIFSSLTWHRPYGIYIFDIF